MFAAPAYPDKPVEPSAVAVAAIADYRTTRHSEDRDGAGFCRDCSPAATPDGRPYVQTDAAYVLRDPEIRPELVFRERQLVLLQRESELTLLKLRAAQLGSAALSISAIFVIFLCLFLLRLHRINRSLLEEKAAFLLESQHRIKNNLQVLSSLFRIESRRVEAQGGDKHVYRDACNRAQTMAILNDRLYVHGDDVSTNARSLLEDLRRLLSDSFGRPEIHLSGDCDAISLKPDTATPLSLIICELVTNAYKYAFPDERAGTISVVLREAEGVVSLTVSDNGLGVEDKMTAAKSGTGLALVRSLVDQLSAQIDMNSSPDGTTWTVRGISAAPPR